MGMKTQKFPDGRPYSMPYPVQAGGRYNNFARQVKLNEGTIPILVRVRNRYGKASFTMALHGTEGQPLPGVTISTGTKYE